MTDPREPLRPNEEIVESEPPARLGLVRMVNGLISVVTGLFAVVLLIHIVLVVGQANMGNPFAQFVDSWANAVNFGLTDLFVVGDERAQVALNHGIAALLWLVIGAVLTTLIARIVLPAGPTRTWYRRTVR